jgi:hypothetical protein
MFFRLLLTSLLLAVLAACIPLTETVQVPTSTLELPSATWTETLTDSPEPFTPTLLPETGTPTLGLEIPPTNTFAPPLPTLVKPTLTVTIAPQPAAESGAIQFYIPGPMSQITSPVRFSGYAIPGYKHKGMIELYGEDGSLLNDELLQLNTDYKWAYFSWSLDFDARGAGEFGRLTLSTRDQYGRLTAVKSVHLVLLSEGQEIINPAESFAERCIIEDPPAGKRISGGTLQLSGKMHSYNDQPLIVELITREGVTVGSALVPISPGQEGNYLSFHVDVPYSVRGYTIALLSVRQPDDIIPGTMYLYSQEIVLNP